MLFSTKEYSQGGDVGLKSRGYLLFLCFFFSLSAIAEVSKKYIVTLEPSAYRGLRSEALRTGSFLGLRTSTIKPLDNLQMLVVTMDAVQAEKIKSHSGVLAVEADQIIPQPHYRFFRKLKKSFLSQRQLEEANRSSKNLELTWGLKAIGADKAWMNSKGRNARILVLDTGIDATHPELVQRFEKGKSFVGGASIVDEVGHGTHTSGTVLADGAGSGLLGVAPEARLLMAKVCNVSGCSTASIVQGIDWGIGEKVDVMNLSLGGPFLSSSAAQAYVRAEKAGVVVVAASGNDGKGTVSFPAAVATVVAVGALNEDLTKAPFSQWGPELDVMAPGTDVLSSVPQGTGREGRLSIDFGNGFEDFKNTAFQNSSSSSKTISAQIVPCGLGNVADFLGKDLKGKIALIERGEIAFADKVTNAIKAEAAGVLIYNNQSGLITGGLQNPVNIPVLMIEQSVGQILAAQTSGLIAEMGIVPSDYASFQGTSMASPHVAGVAALVKSINPTLTPLQVRQLLNDSAQPLLPNPNNEFGKGIVDANAAVKAAAASVIVR